MNVQLAPQVPRAALAFMAMAAVSGRSLGADAAALDPKSLTPKKADHVSMTVISENDLYTLGTKSDRYYTTGQKFTIISGRVDTFGETFDFAWAKFLANLPGPKASRPTAAPDRSVGPVAPAKPGRAEATHLRVATSIGQNFFTPAELHTPDLQTNDRPYAGWLYASTALQARTTAPGAHARLYVWGADFGVVGPKALGKTTQDFVHDRISHSRRAQGWHHQLANEPGLNLYHQTKLRWTIGDRRTFAADAIGHAGFSLGNVATYANAGGILRLGFGLPDDFGADIIRSGADTSQAGGTPPRWGAHLFGGFDVRIVGRDIFLGGNTFAPSHRVAHEVFVGDFQFGATLNFRGWTVAFSQARRTPEFKLQGHAQAYGSIALTFPLPIGKSR